ncbi:NAD(P)H-dependent flavin oxidoreductase [Acuticoccus kandeliae]|uniref:NAD(P)H-dependent flavin oxidoreductase n=1 Tax=Acuticoccus kandeliae TaxID=2073160 RepID=UPI001B3B9BDA|nr:nitronate monooxygenase family protein [Acuticoccus kandeliae]
MSVRALPPVLANLALPVIASPMFLISVPKLVIAQCTAGIVGAFPALNAREAEGEPPLLERWLTEISEALDRHNQANPDRPAAPFAVNQIVHRTNTRLERDLEICVRHKVPIWITSLGARPEVNEAAHAAGGIALHDVINNTYAQKAIDKGADGLIAVCAGAGGHAGPQSPFALVAEIREWFDGPLVLSGAIATGAALVAARALGADLGYVGSPFIAAEEANADPAHKAMIVEGGAEDIVTTNVFSGISANYLGASIRRVGLDPAAFATARGEAEYQALDKRPAAWRDIWSAGQGIGAVKRIEPAGEIVARIGREYRAGLANMARLAQQQEHAF